MTQLRTIEIDFDVHKKIEAERSSFADTPNSVLRRMLQIDRPSDSQPTSQLGGRSWAGKGVDLPHGTELKMEYNGRVYAGHIADGRWVVENKIFNSPSAAAGGVALTKDGQLTKLDGWIYWQVKRPRDSSWLRIEELRPQNVMNSGIRGSQLEESEPMNMPDRSDLPTENLVIAELEALLSKSLRPIDPSTAYRVLADTFNLTNEQRSRLMPNGKDIHWENRVRFARRKLVDSGKIDTSLPRGQWALKP